MKLTQDEKTVITWMCKSNIEALECAQHKQPDDLETLRNPLKKMEEGM